MPVSNLLTGYPSVDKPWLKYYKEEAEQQALAIPQGKTVWDVIESRLIQYKDIPAIEYFGRKISRQEFIDMVYEWARAFKALGVEENDVVPYFGPFFPDVGAMALALNVIGACPYFLKLAMSQEALVEETRDSTLAVVFDEMWDKVSHEFSKERFKNVIVVTVADGMAGIKKQVASLAGKLKHKDDSACVPNDAKYLSLSQAKKLSAQYQGDVRAAFTPDRPAFITSSSGTTVGGAVKGTVATNESTISQVLMGEASELQFFVGERCLNHFPPTASTSLNVLFFEALYLGMTVVMDPRVDEDNFYNHLVQLKPNVALTTGSAWEAFFNRVGKELDSGKRHDFSYARSWILGGEGTDVAKYRMWNDIITSCGGMTMYSGYGSSEVFSAASVEKYDAKCSNTKPVMSVGIPYAGVTIGVFDKDGHELEYNRRGELWIKSKSAMKGYYKKPDLTERIKVGGWIHTGDLAEIDEDGFIYIWGRMNDAIRTEAVVEGCDGGFYLFDVAQRVKQDRRISDAIVLPISELSGRTNLAIHVAWSEKMSAVQRDAAILELDADLRNFLPQDVVVWGWAEHGEVLPYDQNTLKRNRNRLANQKDGFLQVAGDKVIEASLS